MTIIATPVAYEIHDERMLVATITMADEGGSEVVIKGINNPSSWQEVSRAVFLALKQMHPEDKA